MYMYVKPSAKKEILHEAPPVHDKASHYHENREQEGHDGPGVAHLSFHEEQGFKSQPLGYKHMIFYDLT